MSPPKKAPESGTDKPTPAEIIPAIKELGARVGENPLSVSLFNSRKPDVTNALVHLKGVIGLQSLDLVGTEVTDAGLLHLEGLARQENLGLRGIKVTEAGAKQFNAALPKCRIFY